MYGFDTAQSHSIHTDNFEFIAALHQQRSATVALTRVGLALASAQLMDKQKPSTSHPPV